MARRIVILGFADSRTEAPFADSSWEVWGVNDVYAHVPRVDTVFELHHLQNLGNRRNPQHEAFLRGGQKPVVMWDAHPDFPSATAFPKDAVMAEFGSYFTNSISWMTALALLELTEPTMLPDGRTVRLCKPGCELSMYGVDMSATSEYGGQRPSVEYFVGMAAGMGVPFYLPASSDICKAPSLYGVDTSAPLRIKMQSRIAHMKQTKIELMQHLANNEGQRRQFQSQLDQVQGQIEAYKYVQGVWTMDTDMVQGAVLPLKDRGAPMAGSPLALEAAASNGNGHADRIPITEGAI